MDFLKENEDKKEEKSKKEIKEKKSKKTDNCQELKNLAYKTMLLKGNNINPEYNNVELVISRRPPIK